MKVVNNSNFGNAIALLRQADPPPQRGGSRKRATRVSEIDGPSKKVSGSSIQTSIFV
jgi:hypothetical protein